MGLELVTIHTALELTLAATISLIQHFAGSVTQVYATPSNSKATLLYNLKYAIRFVNNHTANNWKLNPQPNIRDNIVL